MLKMPHTCQYHRQVVLLTIVYRIFIADRTSGLDKRRNTRAVCYLYAIIEREERIAR